MDINNDNIENEERELIQQLRNLPVQKVPEDLTRKVMCSVAERQSQPQSGLFASILRRFNRPRVISIQPLYAMSLVVIICGSFMLGRISTESVVSPPEIVADNTNYSFPPTDNSRAAHLMGRGLLAADKQKEALDMLHNAASLEPHNPEYAYWEGVGYWANDDREKERNSYLRGLANAPDSVPLLINLGHNYLSDGNFEQALTTYQSVLEHSPSEQIALYNVGLIYKQQKMVDEEIAAWENYLTNYRTGNLAFRAVKRLNSYGVFSYRTYRIGARSLILSPEILLDPSARYQDKKQELNPIISILKANPALNLEIVVFSENNGPSAWQRALEIKEILVGEPSQELGDRIALSWLDNPEISTVNASKKFTLTNSLLLFSRTSNQTSKEVSI